MSKSDKKQIIVRDKDNNIQEIHTSIGKQVIVRDKNGKIIQTYFKTK